MTKENTPAALERIRDAALRYDLGRMDMKRLTTVYFTYPAVIVYLVLSAAAIWGAVATSAGVQPWRLLAAFAAAQFLYPVVWYGLHRWILHGRWLYRMKWSATLWKRIHYDHHQQPNRMDVLFGSLTNTLPTISLATVPVGYLIGGWSAAFTALATGLLMTCVYEFCHCIQHLNYIPKNKWLARIKMLHMAHHFHNENGNYGIITYWPDALLGTLYGAKERPRSPTVFNLGYDGEEAERYPWVAELSGDTPRR